MTVDNFHVDYATADVTGAVASGWLRPQRVLKRLRMLGKGETGLKMAVGDLVVDQRTWPGPMSFDFWFDVKDGGAAWAWWKPVARITNCHAFSIKIAHI
jgi:hypothetical protein